MAGLLNFAMKAAAAMEYAANHIAGDNRRGVFIRAFVEGEEWAENDLMSHLAQHSSPNETGAK